MARQDRGGERRRDDAGAHGSTRSRGRRRQRRRQRLQARPARRRPVAHGRATVYAHLGRVGWAPRTRPQLCPRPRVLSRMKKILPVAILAVLAIAVPTAQASTTQESIFQDDNVLLSSSSGAGLDQVKGLGANTVHTLVFWTRLAPNVNSRTKPSGDLTNPNTYNASAWAPYDALVRGAAARGIQVLMTPTGFTPLWAQCKHPGKFRNCQPNAKYFQSFVTAVGKRYSGSFTPPGGTTLRA